MHLDVRTETVQGIRATITLRSEKGKKNCQPRKGLYLPVKPQTVVWTPFCGLAVKFVNRNILNDNRMVFLDAIQGSTSLFVRLRSFSFLHYEWGKHMVPQSKRSLNTLQHVLTEQSNSGFQRTQSFVTSQMMYWFPTNQPLLMERTNL